jgi:Ca2+/Na+ antiporter
MGLAAMVFILLVIYLPETLRKIAGDGSKPLYGIYKPLLGGPKVKNMSSSKEERYKPTPLTFNTLFESFKMLAEKDVFVSLIFGAVIYSVWSMITSSTSTLFKEEYNLSDVIIGLTFLPNGTFSLFQTACTEILTHV